MNIAAEGALAGIKILDLTMVLAGPYSTMLLADHGADVVKIEPLTGDMTRRIAPFPEDDVERAYGGYFQSINRNKRSIALDLKSPAGKAVFLRLAEDADVVVENYRVGVMERLELDYERLAAINPRLVYAALRGFGDPRTGSSPYAPWPAYDVVAQAMGGIIGITGPGPGEPVKIGPGVGDIVPALYLSFGILAAVHHAQRTGRGQFLDVAMYDAILSLCERIVYQHSYTGAVPGPEGNHHPLLSPFGIFPAADGWVAIGCPEDGFWVHLCAAMDRPDLARDPDFETSSARVAHRGRVVALVAAWSQGLSKAEIGAAIGGRVPFGPVNTAPDIFADPHIAARSMLAPLPHPGSQKTVVVADTPVKMSATPGGARLRSPRLSEHADVILARAGYGPEEIAALKSDGVVL